MEGFVEGVPLKLDPKSVKHFNSIQIRNAERFVYSYNGNFELVEKMLRTNPSVKKGPRVVVDPFLSEDNSK